LRLATIEDAAAIVDLQIRGWKHSYKGIIDQSYLDNICSKQRLEWRLESMAKGDSWTFVVEHNGKIVGECDAGYSRTPEFGKGEIFALYVDTDHHRKGIATMLWNAAVEKLHQENLVPVIVITLTKNSPARAFYQSKAGIVCSEVQTTIDGKLYDEIVYKVIL
jgi:ribosomal protein S18 acetylase RimI-like enzyme